MPKRKRDDGSLEGRLEKLTTELFRTLKTAKAFERQRQSKRLRDPATTEEKKARIGQEVATLKSLDLHQASAAHIASSILKHKAVAADPSRLPESVRNGVPKPENLTDEQRAALHNVTSSLYNQTAVKAVVDKAVLEVCRALKIEEPRKGKQKGDGGQEAQARVLGRRTRDGRGNKAMPGNDNGDGDDEWNGLDSDGEESDGGVPLAQDDSDLEREEEEALAKYDGLIGSSDDGSSDDGSSDDGSSDDDAPRKMPSTSRFTDDGISLSSHSSPLPDDDDDCSSQTSKASASSPNPSPAAKKAKKSSTSNSNPQQPRAGSSTFLPTLMGGYISGSESEASEVDVAPVKKRLGQRQRQAIYEKKFGARANHIQKQQQHGAKRGDAGRRDDGWDTRRGAIGAEDAGRNRRMPWKKGETGPLRDASKQVRQGKPAPPKQDGSLHPSWQAKARKKQMEAKALRDIRADRIVFD